MQIKKLFILVNDNSHDKSVNYASNVVFSFIARQSNYYHCFSSTEIDNFIYIYRWNIIINEVWNARLLGLCQTFYTFLFFLVQFFFFFAFTFFSPPLLTLGHALGVEISRRKVRTCDDKNNDNVKVLDAKDRE